MVRQSLKTLGWHNIVLNMDDKTVIKMTVGDLRNILINNNVEIKDESQQ